MTTIQMAFLARHNVSPFRSQQIMDIMYDRLKGLPIEQKDTCCLAPGEIFNVVVDKCNIVKSNERAFILDIVTACPGYPLS